MPKQQQCKGVAQLLEHLVCDGICQYLIMHLEGVMCLAFVGVQACKVRGSSYLAQYVVLKS